MDDRDHLSVDDRTWVSEDTKARCFLKVPGFWLCLLGIPVAVDPAEAMLRSACRKWEDWNSFLGLWQ